MNEPRTTPTDADVNAYLAGIEDPGRQRDAEKVCAMMQEITGEQPIMWGTSIIGFGKLPIRYANGKEAEWLVLGLSGRKTALTLYGLHYYEQGLDEVMKLGKVKTGKGCLYIKSLADVDEAKLSELIAKAWQAKRPH